jgi:glycosidase
LAALALNVTTLGIPCIYYGTEQGFDGWGSGAGSDKYIRETMFGGEFGAFRSKGKHFFDRNNSIYKEIGKIAAIRKQKIALRRGRQYLRQISGNNANFGLPSFVGQNKAIRSVIAWSRILDKEEMVLAINTDIHSLLSAWVTIDNNLHSVGETFKIIYSTDSSLVGRTSTVGSGNGRSFLVEVPQAGFVIYEKVR